MMSGLAPAQSEPRSRFCASTSGSTWIEPRDVDSTTQNVLLENVGLTFDVASPDGGRRERLVHCFEMRFGAIDERVLEATGFDAPGPRFEDVFARFWTERYPGLALTSDTKLFVAIFVDADHSTVLPTISTP